MHHSNRQLAAHTTILRVSRCRSNTERRCHLSRSIIRHRRRRRRRRQLQARVCRCINNIRRSSIRRSNRGRLLRWRGQNWRRCGRYQWWWGNGSLGLSLILSLSANSMLSWLKVSRLLHISNATGSVDGRALFVLYRGRS